MYSAVQKHGTELWILKATNLEWHKRDRNPLHTNHKPGPFVSLEVRYTFTLPSYSRIIFTLKLHTTLTKVLRWVHFRFFKRFFQLWIVLIVILWFVVGWLRERQARSYMAIRRLLEKAVHQSLFSLIKWIIAAKATGWSSTFAKENRV